MSLLAIADKKYANTPLASKYLSGNSEHYQSDYLLSVMGKSSKWGDLKTTITLKDPFIASDNSRKYMDYVLQRSLRGELQEVVKAVLAWDCSSEALTLLSASDDHCIFAIALCQALPKLKADVLESHSFAKATKDIV